MTQYLERRMSQTSNSTPYKEKRVKNTGATGWGDNGAARPTTPQYRDNYDAIFGKKKKSP